MGSAAAKRLGLEEMLITLDESFEGVTKVVSICLSNLPRLSSHTLNEKLTMMYLTDRQCI